MTTTSTPALPRQLAELTWTELPEKPVVFVPLGSTEQHGPHLPLETDTVIASALARELAQQTRGYVAPAVSVGASGEHQGFPGVLSIGHKALTIVLVELVRSLSLWAGRIVIVNGHGGNVPALTAAVPLLVEQGHDVSWIACDTENETDSHAGHIETSLMLHLAPWSVRIGRAAPGNLQPLTELMPTLVKDGVRAVTPNGVLGDPRKASAAHGSDLFQRMVARALATYHQAG